jgi:integrase
MNDKRSWRIKRVGKYRYLEVVGYDREKVPAEVAATEAAETAYAEQRCNELRAARFSSAVPITAKSAQERVALVKAGSLRMAVNDYMASRSWDELGPASQRAHRNVLLAICRSLTAGGRERGDLPFYLMDKDVIEAMVTEKVKAGTPEAGRAIIKKLHRLYGWARKSSTYARSIAADPTAEIDRPQSDGDGHLPWAEDEIALYRDYHSDNAFALRLMTLVRYAGARREDLAQLGLQHIRTIADRRSGSSYRVLQYRVSKGQKKKAERLRKPATVPIDQCPELAAMIDSTPRDQMVFLLSPYGRPYEHNSLGNLFRDLCDEVTDDQGHQPLRGLSLHGLRASAAEWWADTWDCSERDLMDIFGWESPKMAHHYLRRMKGDRVAGRLARRAAERNNVVPIKR